MGDNFCLATEIVNGFGRVSTALRTCMKVDLAKTYDSVSWDALENIIHYLKFQQKTDHPIMDCVRSSSFSVLVEGFPTKVFKEEEV